MGKTNVRLTEIKVARFKNVEYGFIDLRNQDKNRDGASVLGLYGQNGSGKTALIDALSILKFALCGKSIPDLYADCISIGAEDAELTFGFEIDEGANGGIYDATYTLSVKKAPVYVLDNVGSPESPENTKWRVSLYREALEYRYASAAGKEPLTRLLTVDDTAETVLSSSSKKKYDALVGQGRTKEDDARLHIARSMAEVASRSFLFSPELLQTVRANCTVERYRNLLEALVFFGNFELFVIRTVNTGLITLDALPLAFSYYAGTGKKSGNIMIPLNGSVEVDNDVVETIRMIVKDMNIVLCQIVPGLQMDVKTLGISLGKTGQKRTTIQLISIKEGVEIPFRCESDGIKKIVSVLQLLISVYNQKSMTVAVDELDAGIFEYLLGELLRIISEKGKGQLIFTSHNLRPLETLNKSFVAFTTTNPKNRYIRLSNVKSHNNVRDFYYRDILLGEQDDPVYDSTNNSEIALAFREAGRHRGS